MVSLGSDTMNDSGGPCCGVPVRRFGLKPTFGQLSRKGRYPFFISPNHIGLMVRRTKDLAKVFNAL
ncbi:MAG: amidase family protein [Symbiopectobacterium sp.]